MQKIRITNKTLEQKIREYARNHQISFQQACTKLFDTGVCHLQKKDSDLKNRSKPRWLNSFDTGVCHPRRVRKITIIKVEVA